MVGMIGCSGICAEQGNGRIGACHKQRLVGTDEARKSKLEKQVLELSSQLLGAPLRCPLAQSSLHVSASALGLSTILKRVLEDENQTVEELPPTLYHEYSTAQLAYKKSQSGEE
jgi:hypothetical protein